jgi:hypothetical protein
VRTITGGPPARDPDSDPYACVAATREELLSSGGYVVLIDCYSNVAAIVLYHVVKNRYLKRRSRFFTTNRALDAPGAVLHDNGLTTAIRDRVLERGRTLVLGGPSHRTMHFGIDDPTAPVASNEPAGLAGNVRQEFPEPTDEGGGSFWNPRWSLSDPDTFPREQQSISSCRPRRAAAQGLLLCREFTPVTAASLLEYRPTQRWLLDRKTKRLSG